MYIYRTLCQMRRSQSYSTRVLMYISLGPMSGEKVPEYSTGVKYIYPKTYVGSE